MVGEKRKKKKSPKWIRNISSLRTTSTTQAPRHLKCEIQKKGSKQEVKVHIQAELLLVRFHVCRNTGFFRKRLDTIDQDDTLPYNKAKWLPEGRNCSQSDHNESKSKNGCITWYQKDHICFQRWPLQCFLDHVLLVLSPISSKYETNPRSKK